MTIANSFGRKTPRKPKRKSKTNAAGQELMAGLKQVYEAVMSGDRFRGMTVREFEIPDPPAYASRDIRATRAKLGVSTTIFAQLMGVSAKLVEHWEQGRRTPAPLACRLLERINADPAGYLGALVRRRELSSRAP
jgi:putative transcriptional regulator